MLRADYAVAITFTSGVVNTRMSRTAIPGSWLIVYESPEGPAIQNPAVDVNWFAVLGWMSKEEDKAAFDTLIKRRNGQDGFHVSDEDRDELWRVRHIALLAAL
jgi:hypothetical protein